MDIYVMYVAANVGYYPCMEEGGAYSIHDVLTTDVALNIIAINDGMSRQETEELFKEELGEIVEGEIWRMRSEEHWYFFKMTPFTDDDLELFAREFSEGWE